LVSDSALYSQDNLSELGDLRWITRVPFSLSEAQDLVSELPPEAFHPCERPDYRWASVCSTYGGVKQLWVVLDNQARIESDLQLLERQVHQKRHQAEQTLRAQATLEFRCEQDALIQTQKLGQRWPYHRLGEIEVIQKAHYDHPGRPKQGEVPTHFTYRICSTVVEDESAVVRTKRKAGRFILATNELEHHALLAHNPVTNVQVQISNLTPERLKILRFFGSPCQKYYLIC
jgi:transposase